MEPAAAGAGAGGVVAVGSALARYLLTSSAGAGHCDWSQCPPCPGLDVWFDQGPTIPTYTTKWVCVLVGGAFVCGVLLGPALDVLAVVRGVWRRVIDWCQQSVGGAAPLSAVEVEQAIERRVNRLTLPKPRHEYKPGQVGYLYAAEA